MMVQARRGAIRYVSTGIAGFDEVAGGGLPSGRVTVIFGGAGSGKTIFGIQTLAAGARRYKEPGIFVAFEEIAQHVVENTASFSWRVDQVKPSEVYVFNAQLSEAVVQGGDFDLLGLLAMLEAKARAMRAKRIVFDGLDVLLGHLTDAAAVRREVFRLREWVQRTGITALITAKSNGNDEQPAGNYEFLQFLADCVVTLQHRVVGGTAHRLLRVTKYRGGAHSANEFPFSIGETGIEVAAASGIELRHSVSNERVSSGLSRLDGMLSGGYYRGSSTLVTGAPGTAKTTLGAVFLEAACRRKERSLLVSFDEAPEQIIRNVGSVGVELGGHVRSGALRISSLRSRATSPEGHVARIRALLAEFEAVNLVLDPISALLQSGGDVLAERAAIQLLDFAKRGGVTCVSTSLLGNKAPLSEETPIGISTIADTWMHLSYVSHGGERNRALTIIKSRGTAHSNQVRELILSSAGIALPDVYLAGGEVLMGTLRWEKENEQRRLNEDVQRDAELREAEAELAVAEIRARAQALLAEQAVREAALARVRAARDADRIAAGARAVALRERRGANELPNRKAPRRSRAR